MPQVSRGLSAELLKLHLLNTENRRNLCAEYSILHHYAKTMHDCVRSILSIIYTFAIDKLTENE